MPKPSAPKSPRSAAGAKAEPVRSNRPRPVAELLPDVGRAAFRKFGFVQSSVVSRWADIVGPKYARVSAPESIRFPMGERSQGTLTLTVAGAHATMMQHIAPEIVDRVNRFFGYGAVAKLVIRQGDVQRAPARVAPPAVRPVSHELGESLRTIADPELKAVLASLAAGVEAVRDIPVIGKVS
ncbi:DciA family protein [Sphingomonas donggukensis]|uniref:DciA family protein n=1 Tax=Sphingomonas donggukensis TaxID=2949093 RepID=A0ABY4TRR7_9SPHN|nr:DciA family protein [Sphingomonas donggukensis]URW75003.1 DciA family protein [Sphingomonas donggukensis]